MCPTHDFDITRSSDTRAVCRLTLNNVTQPDDTRLLYGVQGGEFGMNLVSYQPSEDDEQGYFMLLARPNVKADKGQDIPKTILFVVDRSGSMAGEKIDQAKSSLRLMINQLGPKDTFNVVSYSSEVELFRPELELVNDETRKAALGFVEDIYAGGGTNINDALTTAVSQLQDNDRPNYVLFFTDGLPTVGETAEHSIAINVDQANKVNARIFSFGVGYDVNSRLLDRLSSEQRGTSVYVKPDEDIEVAASNLFTKVRAPAMTEMKLSFTGSDDDKPGTLVTRTYPRKLPDMFRGEQLILVGRYRTSTAVKVTLSGQVAGESRETELEARFGDSEATRGNRFVEMLWATRRIGDIIDELDLRGQNRELVDELVALSLKHGIMTPYTSFLADENQSFRDRGRLTTEARGLSDRLSVASGVDAFSQRRFKSQLQMAERAESKTLEEAADEADPLRRGISMRIGGSDGSVPRRAQGLGRGGSRGRPVAGLGGGGGGGFGPPGLGVIADSRDDEGKSRVAERVRRIGKKTFYWKNDEWQDSDYGTLKEDAQKNVIEVEQFSDKYFRLAELQNGRYSKYLTVTEPLLIRIDGRNYRIMPPKKK